MQTKAIYGILGFFIAKRFRYWSFYDAIFRLPNNLLGTSRLAHLGVSGPFSSLGPVSSHVDAAALDSTSRISPDNNLDFYGYSQAAPYS
ncbi:unnamed protein product, partial [Rotaria socialis]